MTFLGRMIMIHHFILQITKMICHRT